MRDWNGWMCRKHNSRNWRFQHTYEGLKLNSGGNPDDVYESFQHTYEGLKQKFSVSHRFNTGVFSIPMRDWNSVFVPVDFVFCTVFSIPMRDWNCNAQTFDKNILRVFSIPMRDWNRCWVSGKLPTKTCFQHTYEGLKLHLSVPSFHASGMFSAYLWGIETSLIAPVGHELRLVFSIPMRDWNQENMLLILIAQPGFQHTYEGLKHKSFLYFTGILTLFSAYLWGIETP